MLAGTQDTHSLFFVFPLKFPNNTGQSKSEKRHNSIRRDLENRFPDFQSHFNHNSHVQSCPCHRPHRSSKWRPIQGKPLSPRQPIKFQNTQSHYLHPKPKKTQSSNPPNQQNPGIQSGAAEVSSTVEWWRRNSISFIRHTHDPQPAILRMKCRTQE